MEAPDSLIPSQGFLSGLGDQVDMAPLADLTTFYHLETSAIQNLPAWVSRTGSSFEMQALIPLISLIG
jgi:hypothetical protein